MSESNPYATPEANLIKEQSPVNLILTRPKSVSIGRGWAWIAEGFGYFKQNPGAWILTLVVGLILMIVLTLIPVIGQIIMMLTYYVWIGGLMLGCHAQANGEDFQVKYLFAGFSAKPGKLILLSLIMTILGMVVMVIAVGPIYLEMIKGGAEPSPELVNAMQDLSGFWLPMAFGMLFMIPFVMAVWFAPALIVLNDVPLFKALWLSFIGCLKNILPFILYFILAFVLYILAAIPLLLGLLVFMPTMFASFYTAYIDIFTE